MNPQQNNKIQALKEKYEKKIKGLKPLLPSSSIEISTLKKVIKDLEELVK